MASGLVSSKVFNNILGIALCKRPRDAECNFTNSCSADKTLLKLKCPLTYYNRYVKKDVAKAKPRQQPVIADICPIKGPKFKKRQWNVFSALKSEERQKAAAKAEECKKQCIEYIKFQRGPDPDMSDIDGRVFKTCGTAYIIQKDTIPKTTIPESVRWENAVVDKLEMHPELKNFKDPLTEFQSVGQRLIDLADKKLHPLYKKYMLTPKGPPKFSSPKIKFKPRSGSAKKGEMVVRCKFNKEFLDRKNIYVDFKRIEPPRQPVRKSHGKQLKDQPKIEKKESTQEIC